MPMKTSLALLALLWVCAVAPSLCLGGNLVHACDCGIECGHEVDCERDPCAPVLKAEDGDSRWLDLPLVAVPAGGCESASQFFHASQTLRRPSFGDIEPGSLQPVLTLPLLN